MVKTSKTNTPKSDNDTLLSEFSKRVGHQFVKMESNFTKMIDRVENRFDKLDGKFTAMSTGLIVGFLGIIGILIICHFELLRVLAST